MSKICLLNEKRRAVSPKHGYENTFKLYQYRGKSKIVEILITVSGNSFKIGDFMLNAPKQRLKFFSGKMDDLHISDRFFLTLQTPLSSLSPPPAPSSQKPLYALPQSCTGLGTVLPNPTLYKIAFKPGS